MTLKAEQVTRLQAVMLKEFLTWISPIEATSGEGLAAVNDHAFVRFAECEEHIVPWVAHHIDLRSALVLDIGCGTGSSTAAFARASREVHGYDIDSRAIPAATSRMEILGIKNCSIHFAQPAHLLDAARSRHGIGGVDVVVYYAVLEHQTHQERVTSLRACWELLRPGGVLVVTDTPNRLTYGDYHTSFLPFFHTLPHEVAIEYARFSQRAPLRSDFANASARPLAETQEMLIRWGRGVSYHDFELALGELSNLVVGDGFDREIVRIKPIVIEERLLYTYWLDKKVPAPVGFVRQSLDVVLRKPDGTSPPQRLDDAKRLKGVISAMR